jgi:hypothetical protein
VCGPPIPSRWLRSQLLLPHAEIVSNHPSQSPHARVSTNPIICTVTASSAQMSSCRKSNEETDRLSLFPRYDLALVPRSPSRPVSPSPWRSPTAQFTICSSGILSSMIKPRIQPYLMLCYDDSPTPSRSSGVGSYLDKLKGLTELKCSHLPSQRSKHFQNLGKPPAPASCPMPLLLKGPPHSKQLLHGPAELLWRISPWPLK